MANSASTENVIQAAPTEEIAISRPVVEQPMEQLEVEEPANPEAIVNFPTGVKVWLTMISMCITYILNGLVSFSV